MSYDTQAPPSGPHAAMRNGLGTAALILGVIGTLAGLIPLFFWLAGILGVIALILGLVGRGRVKRGEADNKGVTLTGAILGLVALILSVVGLVVIVTAVDDVVNDAVKAAKDSSAAKPSATASASKDPAPSASGPAAKGEGLEDGDTSVYDDDLKVTVSDPKPYTPDEYAAGHTKGNKAYRVTVMIENGGKKKYDTALAQVSARAGKDGVPADQVFDGESGFGFQGAVLPGKKATVHFVFDAPKGAGNLTVEVDPGWEHDASQWELKLG
ncbi:MULTISPECIES: DUF4190 domain-containing protein [unclassified Streptomyces]|uniref:DUF4190 domain-containing protein n=1 Tax=unclassified Streptomyces TaxID=2593676 RepID=UPI001660D8DC|nr:MULTISPECIES: DUF4190 domain-containing protein [unclassified Streptomyces]MBD0709965.1 hypothetical protein [Streptomyces sp. CBMA291]MBD0717120.1 hypothetical protein [Streptomyces sp. CBMA370]